MGYKKRMNSRILREFGVQLLSAYESRLDEAVENDYDLLERTMKYKPGIMDKADKYKSKFKPAVRELETDDVWELMEKKKPELYEKIYHDPETYAWAEEELQAILNYLKQ